MMRFIQNYLRVIAAITLILGLGLLLFAPTVIKVFFNSYNSDLPTEFFARITGCTLIGYSALNYLASVTTSKEIDRIAVWGNLSTLLVAAVVTILYWNKFDSYGWLIVTQHVFFAAGFIYCAYILKKN